MELINIKVSIKRVKEYPQLSNSNLLKIKLFQVVEGVEVNKTSILLETFFKNNLLKDNSINLRLCTGEIKCGIIQALKVLYGACNFTIEYI